MSDHLIYLTYTRSKEEYYASKEIHCLRQGVTQIPQTTIQHFQGSLRLRSNRVSRSFTLLSGQPTDEAIYVQQSAVSRNAKQTIFNQRHKQRHRLFTGNTSQKTIKDVRFPYPQNSTLLFLVPTSQPKYQPRRPSPAKQNPCLVPIRIPSALPFRCAIEGNENATPRKTTEKSNLQEATIGDSFVYDMIIEQKDRKGKRGI